MDLSENTFAAFYLVSTICFIFGLKGLAHPKTALRGNLFSMIGMGTAVIITLLHPSVQNFQWIIAGLLLGAFIGTVVAAKIQMTAMPELVAALHSFVGLSAVLVAYGTFLSREAEMNPVLAVEIAVGSAIGAITFTGSVIAFGKLQGSLGSNPVIFKGQHFLNLTLGLVTLGFISLFVMEYDQSSFLILTGIALLLGILLVIPIGGADMPVVVSMLNSYSGWAAAATGFTLENYLLIATGALVGSSGAILSYIMCKAMNRSIVSVVLGGFGGDEEVAEGDDEGKRVLAASVEDLGFMLENSGKVIVVPGYGMAVAQAQHAVKELYDHLLDTGIEITFAIHPVAGRMPGHMNVLLAESEIPYDSVFELEDINSEFSSTDVVLVIGANDIINPDALNKKTSPLYGMPILEAFKAKQVFVLKRSMKPGYAGVDNSLFYYENCRLVFGDAKSTCSKLVNVLKEA